MTRRHGVAAGAVAAADRAGDVILVLAVAMACWFRGYQMANLDRAYALRAAREGAATEM